MGGTVSRVIFGALLLGGAFLLVRDVRDARAERRRISVALLAGFIVMLAGALPEFFVLPTWARLLTTGAGVVALAAWAWVDWRERRAARALTARAPGDKQG